MYECFQKKRQNVDSLSIPSSRMNEKNEWRAQKRKKNKKETKMSTYDCLLEKERQLSK